MSILVNKSSKILVQGFTGTEGSFHGEFKTGKDGKFEIAFTAIPDLTIDKKFDPVFDYRVYADVTDINGETRSGESLASVSYKSLLLAINIPAKFLADSFKSIDVTTTNMRPIRKLEIFLALLLFHKETSLIFSQIHISGKCFWKGLKKGKNI